MSTIARTKFRVVGDVHVKEFDGEMVLLDLTKGEYYGLNEVGARLWQGLTEGKTCDAIANELAREFTGDRVQILADLVTMTSDFHRRGWLDTAS